MNKLYTFLSVLLALAKVYSGPSKSQLKMDELKSGHDA